MKWLSFYIKKVTIAFIAIDIFINIKAKTRPRVFYYPTVMITRENIATSRKEYAIVFFLPKFGFSIIGITIKKHKS